MAKGIAAAIKVMKEKCWPMVHHLLCRWHVYQAIRRTCIPFFKGKQKGTIKAEVDRMIDAFKAVVLAPQEEQMKVKWDEFCKGAGGSEFPLRAIQYITKEYYQSAKAKMLMECYIFNLGNLHQTTTSRNEGMHHAYRSNAAIIQTPAKSYNLRRSYKQQWMKRIKTRQANARNTIPLDIQHIPEVRELVGKLSEFALKQIRREISLSRQFTTNSPQELSLQHCECHTYHRYNLPCRHMIPNDGSAISLDSIIPFWRIDNWDQGFFKLLIILIYL